MISIQSNVDIQQLRYWWRQSAQCCSFDMTVSAHWPHISEGIREIFYQKTCVKDTTTQSHIKTEAPSTSAINDWVAKEGAMSRFCLLSTSERQEMISYSLSRWLYTFDNINNHDGAVGTSNTSCLHISLVYSVLLLSHDLYSRVVWWTCRQISVGLRARGLLIKCLVSFHILNA